MLRKRSVLAYISVVLLFAAATYGQNKFEGYSFTVEADNGGACPVKYLPSAGAGSCYCPACLAQMIETQQGEPKA